MLYLVEILEVTVLDTSATLKNIMCDFLEPFGLGSPFLVYSVFRLRPHLHHLMGLHMGPVGWG